MDTLYTFWDIITHYNTESVEFLGLINSATRFKQIIQKDDAAAKGPGEMPCRHTNRAP